MIIAPFSAIPSWEGFEYQWHVAVYVALTHIWEKIEESNEKDIVLYSLGIEGAEDFSIIKGDQYISLHQVKQSKEIHIDAEDKACFVLSILQYEVEKAYFHIVQGATISSDFIKETINHINYLVDELGKDVITQNEFIKEIEKIEKEQKRKIKRTETLYKQQEERFIITSKISPNTKKGSVYNILSLVCADNKQKPNVLNKTSEVKSELTFYRDKMIGKSDSDLWTVFNERFATPTDVIRRSCAIIEKMLKKERPAGCIYYDNTYYQFIYDKITIYAKEVIRAHNNKRKKNSCKVAFSEIHDLVTKDHKAASNTTEYQYYELLQSIKDVYNKYPSSFRNDCENNSCDGCASSNECNLHHQMIEIYNKSYEDQKDFIYKLLLRTPKNDLPRDTVINNLFVTLLKKIKRMEYCDSNVILVRKDNEIYRLTLDENEYIEDFEAQLNKEISKCNADKFLIYESDVLITDKLNESDYRYNQSNFNIMGSNELHEIVDITTDSVEQQKNNYYRSKVMRIISKDIAEGELI